MKHPPYLHIMYIHNMHPPYVLCICTLFTIPPPILLLLLVLLLVLVLLLPPPQALGTTGTELLVGAASTIAAEIILAHGAAHMAADATASPVVDPTTLSTRTALSLMAAGKGLAACVNVPWLTGNTGAAPTEYGYVLSSSSSSSSSS